MKHIGYVRVSAELLAGLLGYHHGRVIAVESDGLSLIWSYDIYIDDPEMPEHPEGAKVQMVEPRYQDYERFGQYVVTGAEKPLPPWADAYLKEAAEAVDRQIMDAE